MIADYELPAVAVRRNAERPRASGSKTSAVTSLTPREREIALLLAAERASNRAISARLSISIRTVETHIERIFSKLEIHTRADVATAYIS